MSKEVQLLIDRLVDEDEFPRSRSVEIPASRLKPKMLVMYNDKGPFEVVGVNFDNPSNTDIGTVRLQVPDNPEKWAEIQVGRSVAAFTVVKGWSRVA